MAHIQSVLPLLVLLSVRAVESQGNSICQTMQYRALSPMLQKEHQCMILERMQQGFDQERQLQNDRFETLFRLITSLKVNVDRRIHAITPTSRDSPKAIPSLKGIPLVRDCDELQRNGISLSGVYPIRLPSRNIVNVWCDMELGNGGWTVIQRRMDGSINFTRPWNDYAFGFGNPNSEYWFGNDNIYWMTNFVNYSLRVDLWDWEDNHAYALYNYFRIDSEKEFYRLKIEGYSGDAGDAMSQYHDNMKFSTIDSDNDEWFLSCARKDQSGWWFRACGFASLNGFYIESGKADIAPDGLIKGIIWYNWKNDYGYSMKRTEMKIKPMVSVKIDKEKEKLKEMETSKLNETEKNIDGEMEKSKFNETKGKKEEEKSTEIESESDVSSGSGDISEEHEAGQRTLRQLSKILSPKEFKKYKEMVQSGLTPEKFGAIKSALLKSTTTTATQIESTDADTTTEVYDYYEYDGR